MKSVVIINSDSSPVRIEFTISDEALQQVLKWYFVVYFGDNITVQIDGAYVETNENGDIIG